MLRRDLYSIGEFSRLCRLTVKALRHYDEVGLFKPGHIDAQSSYRYYSSSQLPEANLIRVLRSMEFTLEETQRFLRERDPEKQMELLEKHRIELEKRMEEYRHTISSIQRLTEGKGKSMERKFELKDLASQPVLGLRYHTSLAKIGDDSYRAYMAVFAYLGERGEFPAGPPFAIYHDMEFKEEDIDIEACVPVSHLLSGRGEVEGSELPGGKMASTMHAGPYDEIGEAYEALMLWINDQGYRPSGPCREVYLVGPPNKCDPADYRTEILCPIE